MQVFKDIRDLWGRPFDGANILTVAADPKPRRVPQFSVMVLDCGSLDWNIQEIVSPPRCRRTFLRRSDGIALSVGREGPGRCARYLEFAGKLP